MVLRRSGAESPEAVALKEKVDEQGNKVRFLKDSKANKVMLSFVDVTRDCSWLFSLCIMCCNRTTAFLKASKSVIILSIVISF